MIRHSIEIKSFEELQKILKDDRYSKVTFVQNKNKNKHTILTATLYYKQEPHLLVIKKQLHYYKTKKRLPAEVKEMLSGLYTAICQENSLKVSQWQKLFEYERDYRLVLKISKKIKRIVNQLTNEKIINDV
jgi:hypothetical protein